MFRESRPKQHFRGSSWLVLSLLSVLADPHRFSLCFVSRYLNLKRAVHEPRMLCLSLGSRIVFYHVVVTFQHACPWLGGARAFILHCLRLASGPVLS